MITELLTYRGIMTCASLALAYFEDLEQKELLDRAIISEKPFRVQYSLTDRGADLRPVIEAMDRWGRDHLQSASDEEESIV